VRRLLDEHFQARRDHSARIWRLLMFEMWQRNFLENVSTRGVSIGAFPLAAVSGEQG
jgi:hypothetical protein